jgi:hypothetical protein
LVAGSGLDVFVSYAHADNGIPHGTAADRGWVTALASNLNVGPNVLVKRFFIDHQLRPGDDFNDDLFRKVEQSSLLLLLLSQNYIESSWCGKELAHFIRIHSSDPEKPQDVFVVELAPYESFDNVPENIQLLRKRVINAKFWYQRGDASAPSLAGFPSPTECGKVGCERYWSVLDDLRGAVDHRLRELRARPLTQSEPAPSALDVDRASRSVARPPNMGGTVLLADTTEDLEAQRNAVKLALEPEGIVVVPEGDYVGLTAQEFDATIAEDLAHSALFVQLLSSTAGRTVKGLGFAAPLPQLQFEKALKAKVPIVQWCEALPNVDIVDSRHAKLFETPFLRVTHLEDFKTIIVDQLAAEVRRRQLESQERSAATQGTPRSTKRTVFVDDFAGETELSDRLRVLIRQHGCDLRSIPAGVPLGNNGIDIKQLLRPCRAGITLFTDRNKKEAAFNRLLYFLNQVAEGDLPVARWGVYLEHGTVASEFGIESDDVVTVDESGLGHFLSGL